MRKDRLLRRENMMCIRHHYYLSYHFELYPTKCLAHLVAPQARKPKKDRMHLYTQPGRWKNERAPKTTAPTGFEPVTSYSPCPSHYHVSVGHMLLTQHILLISRIAKTPAGWVMQTAQRDNWVETMTMAVCEPLRSGTLYMSH
jgi:hypothetical protein